MDRRTRFFWSISIMAGVFVILIEGISLYNVRADRLDFAKAAEKTIIGTDEELEEIIVFLEQNLELRSKFRFDLKNNPLKLDKVVFLADEQGRLINSMQANTIRVSGLYVNIDPPKATIEFKNKEHTVKVGDKIEDYSIVKITNDGILALRQGDAKFYPLQGRTLNPDDTSVMSRKSQYDQEEDY